METVVFAGGGVRGLAFVGALQVLRDEKGIDFGARAPHVKTAVGVSVGTLFALMICLGFTVAEITDVASMLKQSDILETDPVRLFSGELSLDNGSKLKSHVEALLVKKGFSKSITFLELAKATQTSMHLVVTDLTTAGVVHVSELSHPSLSVVTAMMASMTIPLVYPPVVAPDGHLWIDGGVLENFPVSRYKPDGLLGFDFEVKIECKADTLLNYVARVIYVQQVPMDVVAWKLMSNQHKERCILIDTGTVSTLRNISDLTPDLRIVLLDAGKAAARKKLQQWAQQQNMEKRVFPENLPYYLTPLH